MGQFMGGRKERKESKKENQKEKKRGREQDPASCSGWTLIGSERNCATRCWCLPTSVLFYA